MWPRGVARLAHDPWAAALVAQHAIAIFDRYRSDTAWTRFFAEMETMRREMLEASGLLLPELLADYRFVGLGDVISLTFCNGWTDVQRFDPWSVRLSGSQVFVSPDPFDGSTIPIGIEAKEILGAPSAATQSSVRSSPPPRPRLAGRCYFVAALTGSGAGVEHGVALKLASFGSFRNDVLV